LIEVRVNVLPHVAPYRSLLYGEDPNLKRVLIGKERYVNICHDERSVMVGNGGEDLDYRQDRL
jgi:hypothetical protein